MSIRGRSLALATTIRRGLLVGAGVGVTLSLVYSAALADTVYKWVDAQNRVHYSDRPPPDGEQAVAVNTGYSKSTHGTDTAPPAKAAPSPASTTTSQTSAEKKVAADIAAAHAGDCQKATETYNMYIHSRRLFKNGDNNERIYLSDEELDQARLNARRDMDLACSPGP